MGKQKIMPNWEDVCYVLVKNGEKTGCKPVIQEFEPGKDDFLSLRATMEIAGGDFAYLDRIAYPTPEAVEKARLEVDRCAAWNRGLGVAALLLQERTYSRFVVAWEPGDVRTRETVSVYQLL